MSVQEKSAGVVGHIDVYGKGGEKKGGILVKFHGPPQNTISRGTVEFGPPT